MRKILFCDNSLKEQLNFRGDVINNYAADGFEVVLVSPLNCDFLAAKFCGIPSSAMIAGLGYVFDKKGLGNVIARGLYRFALQFSQKVLVLNSYNRDVIINKHIAKSNQVILLPGGEGINLDKFKIEDRNEEILNDSSHPL